MRDRGGWARERGWDGKAEQGGVEKLGGRREGERENRVASAKDRGPG